MSRADAELSEVLNRLGPRRMERRLVRCVPQLSFTKLARPRFLYTSGRPNRCNPRGVDCLYFSETERVAGWEYARWWHGTEAEHQPKLTFHARVRLRAIVDLAKRDVLAALGLGAEDLEAPWRTARRPTRLQELGRAIASHRRISAVRYPSTAARQRGRSGWNVAIYPSALVHPDRVEILGDSGTPLEELP